MATTAGSDAPSAVSNPKFASAHHQLAGKQVTWSWVPGHHRDEAVAVVPRHHRSAEGYFSAVAPHSGVTVNPPALKITAQATKERKTELRTMTNQKFQLMLKRCAKAYSSSCSQTVSHSVYLHPFRRNFYGGTAI